MDEIKRSGFDGWVTMQEAADLTGAPRSTLTKAVRLGELNSETIGTSYIVRVEDAMAWARSRRGPGRPYGSRAL